MRNTGLADCGIIIVIGRFAPSPTGDLHLGNLRTALVAWLSARSQGGGFLVRIEDLDRMTSSEAHLQSQLAALRWIGIDWDEPVVRQSERLKHYADALARLDAAELTYPCFCSRAEIAAAVAAPHGSAEQPYPGTCRSLTADERLIRQSSGRVPAIRLRATKREGSFIDGLHGNYHGWIDDVVLRRNDGVAAYNLAVVVDDHAQGVTEVVRGDDLLASTPRQILLGELLGAPPKTYLHVPLVLGPDGTRLAKRHGDVTVSALARRGVTATELVGLMAWTLGIVDERHDVSPRDLLSTFDATRLKRHAWLIDDSLQRSDADL